ncbi:hypothetical protein BHM03_00013437 [Ensete ventricosum]|nr:hypothetical protein BHM03_00013437 [Ensete ventricosum]
MGLITHNRIYVCIGASPCPVIVDLVINGSVGSSHLYASCLRAAAPSGRVGTAYARRCHPYRRQPCMWAVGSYPLQAAPVATWPWPAALAGGSSCSRAPLQVAWPWVAVPTGAYPQLAAPLLVAFVVKK